MFLPTNKSTDKLIQCHTVIRQFQSPHDVASVKGFLDELKMRIVSCLDNNSPISTLTRSSATTRMLPKQPMIMITPTPSTTVPRPPTSITPLHPDTIPQMETVDTYSYVFDTVWNFILDLHTKEPRHPMFGKPVKGCIRLPLYTEKTGYAQLSWNNRVKCLASSVRDSMGQTMIKGSCWMALSTRSEIRLNTSARQSRRKLEKVNVVKFTIVRWLHFLANPSPQNWDIITGEKRGLPMNPNDHPFCHSCHNGEGSTKSRNAVGRGSCINGVEHGCFGTTALNNKMKACKGRSRAKCPGHGSPPTHCFYVHRNGRPKACLNLEVIPLSCSCELKCF
jgi:hypothetical protein